MANFKFDDSELKKLIKSLHENYTLRVGVIGSKGKGSHGKGQNLSNADVGTFHEFGTEKMPRRSFLEDSLKFKLKDFNTEKFRALRKLMFKWFFDKKAPQNFLNVLGAKCLEYIEEGFATNGFGMWKPLASGTEKIVAKKHKVKTLDQAKNASIATWRKSFNFWIGRNILTETGKLRRSIGFKVFKKQ